MKLLPALVQLGNTSQLVGSYLSMIDDSAKLWDQANPNSPEADQLRSAMTRARLALIALERIGTSSKAYQAGDVASVGGLYPCAYRRTS